MVTANDVDCKLDDFSHAKIHRHQTTIEITAEWMAMKQQMRVVTVVKC
jgi:hypothetical protein